MMNLEALELIPFLRQVKPQIVFTGLSTYVFNPATGRIAMHIDVWDSISNNEYFSAEGFLDFLKQLLRHNHKGDQSLVMKRLKELEIRRQQDGSLVAVRSFGGPVEQAGVEHTNLVKACKSLGLETSSDGYKLTKDTREILEALKRHEVMIEIDTGSFMSQWP